MFSRYCEGFGGHLNFKSKIARSYLPDSEFSISLNEKRF